MIIERPYVMPYAYTVNADVQKKRSVASETFVNTGYVEGTVKEVSLSDAPVVLSWTVGMGSGAVDHEVRHFDGRFYIAAFRTHDVFPAKYEHGTFPKTDLPARPGQKSHSAAKLCLLSHARFKDPVSIEENRVLQRVLSDGFFIPAVDSEKVVKVNGTSEPDRRAAAVALLADALIVNRDLWIRIEEPRFLLRRAEIFANGGGYKPMADIYFGPTDCHARLIPQAGKLIGSPDLSRFFRVDDLASFDDALAGADLERDFRGFKVHDPSVFTTDWSLNARVRLVDFAVSGLASGIGAQAGSVIAAWVDARDAASRFRDTGDRSVIDDVVETGLPILASGFEGAEDVVAELVGGFAVVSPTPQVATLSDRGLRL
ncbi:hypothetical protein OIU34_20270 [Pararhizobium sp. BT-229]|uniref:hypothetical protein n=1 Tax=Pararhizobium sp. BT-229 TaxID=2986923 RepID=UPI0021F7ABAA|nr:hypothetical protein [Pararhizobium sp. BT-229]MCV9964224.1 hypothetical protein [Pararhizobium sp. BT-229]